MSSETVNKFARRVAESLLTIAFSVVISNRLVTSACAVVADTLGYTANLEKLMSKFLFHYLSPATIHWGNPDAAHNQDKSVATEFLKKQRTLEINPKSPLIEGLLARVEDLNSEEEKDTETEKELKEVASILIDGALVRSGFEVHDSNE